MKRIPLPYYFLLASCLSSAPKNGGGDLAMTGADAGAGADDAGAMDVDTSGGSLALVECGYSVVTRDGASAPARGQPVLGADAKPFAIHLSIAGDASKAADPRTSMAIVWRTGDNATLATTVQYGAGGMTDKSYEGVTYIYNTTGGGTVRIHEAHLCGLTADTTYSYRVGGKDASSGKESWSDVYTFRTAPASADSSVVVAVIGDTRGGYSTWGSMLKLVESTATPDLILFSGDGVSLGPVQSEWDTWFTQAAPVLHRAPLLGAHGNHDVNSVNYFSQFALPGNEEDYGLDYGPFHLTVANDTPVNPGDIQGANAQFIEQDFTASDGAGWKIFMHHKPMWSACAGHGGDPAILAAWGPIVDKHKIDLVLNGHDHDYERTKPMRGMAPQVATSAGTVYVVAGSAGADLYDNGTGAWTALSKKTFNFVILKIRKGAIDAKTYDDAGTVIDTFSMTK